MIEHRYVHRVRYRECDPMGVVYHAHFVDHFEFARTEALRAHGLPYRALEESGIIMPVAELSIQYLRPARYDDLLEIHVAFPEPPSARIRAEYETIRLEPGASGDVIVRGTVTLAFLDRARQRPVRAPAALRQVFEPYYDGR